MATDRGSGPGVMSDDDLRAWMSKRPTGAMCMLSDDGRFRATPVVVQAFDGDVVTAVVASPELAQGAGRACIVADEFESYEGIRGVIIQGAIERAGAAATVEMAVERLSTFSFARPTNGETSAG